jgi:integron integrase
MEHVNMQAPINRTLAVIDGGLNAKGSVRTPAAVQQPRLLDQVRLAIRTRHYSYKTEESYVHWIKRFIFFNKKRHPAEMSEKEIAQFLSSLASELHVSASTQNQALNAILFLYREVLRKEIGYVDGVIRAKKSRRLPVVLTKEEVKTVLGRLSGAPWLMSMLLYGAGLRLMECCRLRVKDIDFSQNQILVRARKGDKDRYTMLPAAIKQPLLRHLEGVKRQHDQDLKRNLGRVALPNALEKQYPNAVGNGAGNGYFRRPVILRTG